MKKQLLFVTYGNQDACEGFSYVIELAKTLKESIAILLVYPQKAMGRFESLMSAVTFAEAGEQDTARELMAQKEEDEEVAPLLNECGKHGIQVRVHSTTLDIVSGVTRLLKDQSSVDMVLLSPAITNNGFRPKQLSMLVKTASRPIVTIARQHSH